MTPQQSKLFEYLERYIKGHGYCPSYQEMNSHMGLHSKSGIHRLVSALEERGYIKRLPHRARAIEIIPIEERQAYQPNTTQVTLQFADGCETTFICLGVPESIRRKFLLNKRTVGIVGVLTR